MSAISTSPWLQWRSIMTEEFPESITREQMDEFVRSGNIREIKTSLSQGKVFKEMLSEHFFGSEVLGRLLISAIEDDTEVIKEVLLEYSGSVQYQEREDPERLELVRLLLEHHSFDPEIIQPALEKASKYGRIELVSQLVIKADLSQAMMESALLEAVRYGWLDIVDLLLKEPVSEAFDKEIWREGIKLSHALGFDSIACLLIQKMGSMQLEEIKQDLSGHSSALFFIDRCLENIEYLKSLCLQVPPAKRRRFDSDLAR